MTPFLGVKNSGNPLPNPCCNFSTLKLNPTLNLNPCSVAYYTEFDSFILKIASIFRSKGISSKYISKYVFVLRWPLPIYFFKYLF